jgi:beta-ribofuranosylaminobenzene 5'-phosphate synthase
MLKIITPSRLHFTLLDLSASIGRMDGGIGLALNHPRIVIEAEKWDENIVGAHPEVSSVLVRQASRILSIFGRKYGTTTRINIQEAYPPHVGLGSGTQVSLGVAKAISLLYRLKLSVRDLAKICGRGGTSGIGIAAFDKGGFVLDGGHSLKEKKDFLPSSVAKAGPPPIIFQHRFPEWDIVVAVPDLKGSSGKDEVKKFQLFCPIPRKEVEKLSHLVLLGLLPSLLEEDIDSFGRFLTEIQKIGFKRREVEIQHPVVRKLMRVMINGGAYGAGMSSFGPAVYGITENPEEVERSAKELLSKTVGGNVYVTRAKNRGASVIRFR